MGPLDGLSNLYATGERKWEFQKHGSKLAFFEMPKTFTVRMGGQVGGGKKGPLIFLKFEYSNKQDVLITNLGFKNTHVNRPFSKC